MASRTACRHWRTDASLLSRVASFALAAFACCSLRITVGTPSRFARLTHSCGMETGYAAAMTEELKNMARADPALNNLNTSFDIVPSG